MFFTVKSELKLWKWRLTLILTEILIKQELETAFKCGKKPFFLMLFDLFICKCFFVPPTGPYMAEGRGRWAGPSMPVRRLAAVMSDSGWEWAGPQQVNAVTLVFVKR